MNEEPKNEPKSLILEEGALIALRTIDKILRNSTEAARVVLPCLAFVGSLIEYVEGKKGQ